jgi:hypothetical protein
MIKFTCVQCGRVISVEARHGGKKGKCPKCGTVVTVPARSTVISFQCGTCAHRIEVPEVHAGKKGKCPKCKNVVVVPATEKDPVERAQGVTCAICGRTIGPTESREPLIECPGCGASIEASSGALSPQSDGSLPSNVDEGPTEEPPAVGRRAAGLDRRLIILVAAVATVLVVGGVVLIVALRSSSPRPGEGVRARRTVAAASSGEPVAQGQTRPDAASKPAGPEPAAETTGTTRLQFHPTPGTKRTVRLVTKSTTSTEPGGRQQGMTSTESIDFDLEVMEPPGDGTSVIGVTLAAVRVQLELPGQVPSEYDSTKPRAEGDARSDIYGPFLSRRFTIRVSAKGEITDTELDGLFLAVAEQRVKSEDTMLRTRLKDKSDQAIQKMNEQFGSREGRVLAMKKQLEEFPVLGRDQLTGLVDSLIVALPEKPQRLGDTWQGSLNAVMGLRVRMAAQHTLSAVGQEVCTIKAAGRRNEDEDPLVQGKASHRLGGSGEATLLIDRRTGWLMGKDHKISLHGKVTMAASSGQAQNPPRQLSIEITSTMATLK